MKRKPIQVIRSRFNEITLWRSQGTPWSEISNELQIHANTLSILYQRELKRRTSPEYITATRWVSAHHDTIAELLARGFTWVSITNLVPVVPKSSEASPMLEMLIVEYESVTVSHIPEPEPTNQPVVLPSIPQPIPQPSPPMPELTPLPETPARHATPVPKPATAQSQESSGPFTGRMKEYNALFMEADAKKKAEDAKAQRKKEYQKNRKSVFHVKEDPYVSVAELRAEYDKWCKIHSERVSLYREIPDDDESQADLKFEHQRLIDDAEEMRSGYFKLIGARTSHRLTSRSKLCVLATAALACGVYVLADTDTPAPPDAITLHGFDRPDAIVGMTEIPDPVIIRPEFTQDEIERRDAAYHDDTTAEYDSAQVPTSPKRLIAEALILRGSYALRHNGWIRYDEIVELSGDDIPSPSLCGHPASRTELTLAPPLSPSDPKKDDYSSDHQCDLAREQFKGDWL
ncbi:MAG: hypothetical protein ACYCU8_06580 [Ferrimicrobium acidiphilum]